MAKCTRLYSGYNSLGVRVEVAQSVSGAWFCREYGFNGYGKGFSKWEETDAPELTTEIRKWCDYTRTERVIEVTEGDKIDWGFTTLDLLVGYTRARLPH